MYDKSQNEAGPKAKTDIVHFLEKSAFKGIEFYFNGGRKAELLSFKQVIWDIPHRLNKLTPGVVLFQYPAFNARTNTKIVQTVRKNKGAKLFYILHDVESLRHRHDDVEFLKDEINFFNQSDGLIVHNDKMLTWLKEKGVTRPMVSLQLFDYDNPQPLLSSRPFERTLCFAGNLKKSTFLSKLQLKHRLELFGPNQCDNYRGNIHYRGSFTPEFLPCKLTQNFGLIWDGGSLKTCDDKFGSYLRYNDPHKASLYLSSGLPVIIWEKAALAGFVKKHRLGILIADLHDLDGVLEQISESQYQELCINVERVAHKLRSGYFIRNAWNSLLEKEQESLK
ncbi:beta-1,6-galactofuranosyltransferase [Liquorilactobacillus oeni]|uniref:Beta-1,6-galactofuranosyltransferase n=1 Tax=Liquorilactobacillus oeni DSM 19972 TaxID=1423777 RepID=A0A0R1MAG0_9LACO|nr:beta-1,6-galactofuranosyltransferase [Liquorilactobacillus oeni]KRL05068.1 beta-1,6-galactofuranosyltransferase [Liquorilactobacillus oeni DSM 19972]